MNGLRTLNFSGPHTAARRNEGAGDGVQRDIVTETAGQCLVGIFAAILTLGRGVC